MASITSKTAAEVLRTGKAISEMEARKTQPSFSDEVADEDLIPV